MATRCCHRLDSREGGGMMETQTLKDIYDGMLLIEAMFKEHKASNCLEQRALLLARLDKFLPGHRDQLPLWLADGVKGVGK